MVKVETARQVGATVLSSFGRERASGVPQKMASSHFSEAEMALMVAVGVETLWDSGILESPQRSDELVVSQMLQSMLKAIHR